MTAHASSCHHLEGGGLTLTPRDCIERRRSKKAPAAIKHEGVHGGRRSQKGNWEALSGHNCRENAIISGTIFTAFYCQWSVQPIRSEIGYIFQLIQTGLLDPKSFHLPKSHVFPIQNMVTKKR